MKSHNAAVEVVTRKTVCYCVVDCSKKKKKREKKREKFMFRLIGRDRQMPAVVWLVTDCSK